jgi:hypothetical protein
MAYTFARASAVLKLKRGDYSLQGKRSRLRLLTYRPAGFAARYAPHRQGTVCHRRSPGEHLQSHLPGHGDHGVSAKRRFPRSCAGYGEALRLGNLADLTLGSESPRGNQNLLTHIAAHRTVDGTSGTTTSSRGSRCVSVSSRKQCASSFQLFAGHTQAFMNPASCLVPVFGTLPKWSVRS